MAAKREFNYRILKIFSDIETGMRGEILRVAVIDYGSGPRLDIRKWFKPDPEKQPGIQTDEKGYAMGKGTSAHLEDLEELYDAIHRAYNEFEEGLYD